MIPRRSTFRQALSLALAALLSGMPSMAAAAGAQGPPPVRSETPFADAAIRTAVQTTGTRTEMPPGLKWTGFGLIIGGGSLIGLGAISDCVDYGDHGGFGNDVFDDDCETARKASYLAGGIMAGVGVGLLIMAHASRRPVSPTVTMQHGRLMIQQRVRF